jgi:replicative DNA helicase
MFIHREDKYGDANEKNNVVQILIEKHRNGPTGMVELMFDDKKASFVSIEKSDFGDFSIPKIAVDF